MLRVTTDKPSGLHEADIVLLLIRSQGVSSCRSPVKLNVSEIRVRVRTAQLGTHGCLHLLCDADLQGCMSLVLETGLKRHECIQDKSDCGSALRKPSINFIQPYLTHRHAPTRWEALAAA